MIHKRKKQKKKNWPNDPCVKGDVGEVMGKRELTAGGHLKDRAKKVRAGANKHPPPQQEQNLDLCLRSSAFFFRYQTHARIFRSVGVSATAAFCSCSSMERKERA